MVENVVIESQALASSVIFSNSVQVQCKMYILYVPLIKTAINIRQINNFVVIINIIKTYHLDRSRRSRPNEYVYF